MNFQVFMSPFLLLLLIFFLTANIPPSVGHLEPYLACVDPFKCGDFTANYPFWGSNRPPFCGRAELELKCEDRHTPMINIDRLSYAIRHINETSQTLRISREDYQNGLCNPKFIDTTMHHPHLDYCHHSEIEMITLFYDCPPPHWPTASPDPMMIADFHCPGKYGFAMKKNYRSPSECHHNVTIPINKKFISPDSPWLSDIEMGLKEGFEVKWNISIECQACIHSNGRCVIDIEKGKVQCYCSNQSTVLPACPGSPVSPAPSQGHWKLRTLKISIAIPLGVTAGITILVCILLIFQRQKLKLQKVLYSSEKQKQLQNSQTIEDFLRSYGCHGPQIYSYYDIKMMTDFFSTKLGQGGFGDVYKGELCDGRHVAVKLLKESKENGEEFINEVASISRTSHVNVVTLLGFCFVKKKQALVYEFMPNGSLDKYIYGQESSITTNQLGWNTLYRIGVGIARGLEYLHSGCNTRIVHFDIKPHNILLDEDFCPKISDFGLSKLCKRKESIMSMLGGRGTPGYIAPEVFNRNFGEVSHKSDVYSYGMMIIEMVGGRKNMDARGSQESEIYFHDWIYKYTKPGNELHGAITEEEKELAKKMILVSLWCIQAIPSDRPSISKVVEMLEGRVEDLQAPPKPSLCSPVRSIKWSSQTSSTVS